MSLTKDETLEVVKKFGKDEKDTGSTAVQIALLTKRIEDLQGHFKTHKKDNHSRTGFMLWENHEHVSKYFQNQK